jgi:hypothetical protein
MRPRTNQPGALIIQPISSYCYCLSWQATKNTCKKPRLPNRSIRARFREAGLPIVGTTEILWQKKKKKSDQKEFDNGGIITAKVDTLGRRYGKHDKFGKMGG